MPKKNYKPEEIVQHLRTVEIECSKGTTKEEAAKKVGISYQTLIRWQKEYGSLGLDKFNPLGFDIGLSGFYMAISPFARLDCGYTVMQKDIEYFAHK